MSAYIYDGDSNLKRYFSSIKAHRLLSAEEELELAKRVRGGDEGAKVDLLNANLRLVVRIAKGYVAYENSLIDLIQEGNIGLIRAAEKFDPEMGYKFSTYASYWIKHSITRFIAKRSRAIRVPIRKNDLYKKIARARSEYFSVEGREPSGQELSDILGVEKKAIAEVLDAFQSVVSLDAPMSGEDFTMKDVVADLKGEDLLSDVFRSEMSREITAAVDCLVEKERDIISRRFGLYGRQASTLKQIGFEMGVSAETIRQIEARALEKIRVRHQHLREYVM